MTDDTTDYDARGYHSWGRPVSFTPAQSHEHQRRVQAAGKCGATATTSNLGVAVCDQMADVCEGGHLEAPRGHRDGRHQVVWDYPSAPMAGGTPDIFEAGKPSKAVDVSTRAVSRFGEACESFGQAHDAANK